MRLVPGVLLGMERQKLDDQRPSSRNSTRREASVICFQWVLSPKNKQTRWGKSCHRWFIVDSWRWKQSAETNQVSGEKLPNPFHRWSSEDAWFIASVFSRDIWAQRVVAVGWSRQIEWRLTESTHNRCRFEFASIVDVRCHRRVHEQWPDERPVRTARENEDDLFAQLPNKSTKIKQIHSEVLCRFVVSWLLWKRVFCQLTRRVAGLPIEEEQVQFFRDLNVELCPVWFPAK